MFGAKHATNGADKAMVVKRLLEFAVQAGLEARRARMLGRCLFEEKRLREALVPLEQALQLKQARNEDTTAVKNDIASVWTALGWHTKALELEEEVWRDAVERHGPEHPLTAQRQSQIADTLTHLGKYEAACAKFAEALRVLESALGADHPTVLTTRSNMAGVLKRQGRLAEALDMLRRFLPRASVCGCQPPGCRI